MRKILYSHKELSKELAEVKSFLLKHSSKTDQEFKRVWAAIDKLSEKPPSENRRIGFRLND